MNRRQIYNILWSIYCAWEGDSDGISLLSQALKVYSTFPEFNYAIIDFHASAIKYNKKFWTRREKLFWGVYRDIETEEFLEIKNLIESYLPHQENAKPGNFFTSFVSIFSALAQYAQENTAQMILFTLALQTACNAQGAYAADNRYARKMNPDLNSAKAATLVPIPKGANIQSYTLFYPSMRFAQTIDEKRDESLIEFIPEQKNYYSFLSNNPEIVIRVSLNGGMNYGNQAAVIGAMTEFRQKYDFQGYFELIYGDDSREKLLTLFDLNNSLPPIYADQTNKVIFLHLDAYMARLKDGTVTRVNLGFTVGNDKTFLNSIEDPVKKNDIQRQFFFSSTPLNANFFATNYFITFSPYLHSKALATTQISRFDEVTPITIPNSEMTYLITPISSHKDVDNYFSSAKGQSFLNQRPALSRFLSGMKNSEFDVLNVYARTVRFPIKHKSSTTQHLGLRNENGFSSSEDNLVAILIAARYAQINGPVDRRRALIIAFPSACYEELNLVATLCTQQNSLLNQRIQLKNPTWNELQLENSVISADIMNPSTMYLFSQLQPNNILLLSLDKLPKVVFDWLLNYRGENSWAPVIEGMTAMHILMQSGHPFFECSDIRQHGWTPGYLNDMSIELKERMMQLYDKDVGFCKGAYLQQGQIHVLLGQFMLEARFFRDSPFSLFAQKLKKKVLEPKNNRISQALDHVDKLDTNDFTQRQSHNVTTAWRN